MHSDGSVLIVDDEPAVRSLIARQLLLAGVKSESLACPEEAMERIGRSGVSLVVIDISLGDADATGVDLLQRIRGAWPEMPVVFVTGYAEMAVDHPDVPLLVKPFDMRELVLLVKREIRNRCRDVQLEQTHILAHESHAVICEVRDALMHPETGLKATHDIAKVARDRDAGEILGESFKGPLQKMLGGLIVLLLGAVVTMGTVAWKLLAAGAVKP